jgi:hypothetical protein
VLFWPTSDRQSAAVVWLVQVLTSLGVAPSLATFSRLDVLMNAAIVAPVSLFGSMAFPQVGWRGWTAYGFVAAVLVENGSGCAAAGPVGVVQRRGREHGRDARRLRAVADDPAYASTRLSPEGTHHSREGVR